MTLAPSPARRFGQVVLQFPKASHIVRRAGLLLALRRCLLTILTAHRLEIELAGPSSHVVAAEETTLLVQASKLGLLDEPMDAAEAEASCSSGSLNTHPPTARPQADSKPKLPAINPAVKGLNVDVAAKSHKSDEADVVMQSAPNAG